MPTLTFPTRPRNDRCAPGTPDRAEHCQCIGPWPDHDHCLRCGHDSRATIDRAWQIRAAVIAGKRKPATSCRMTDHPDDDVTDAQHAYTAAFLEWFRTGSDTDLRRRETAFVRMICEPRAQQDDRAAA